MFENPWLALGLAAFGLAVTLVTNWIASLVQGPRGGPGQRYVAGILADILWAAIVFVAGAIAIRYIERLPNAALGYLSFGLLAFLLSLARALLYQRIRAEGDARPKLDTQALLRVAQHNLLYLLFAVAVYLALAWLLRRPVLPIHLLPLCVGALFPDLDSRTSLPGRLLPFISKRLEARFGHGQEWHSLGAAALVALLTMPLLLVVDGQVWALISLGVFCHLLVDLFTPQGLMLLWPLRRTRFSLLRGPIQAQRDTTDGKAIVALAIVVTILLLFVDFGPPPPAPVAAPTYDQIVEQYYDLRGRNLVFAEVEGAWQATGRRMSDRYEILNAAGSTFTMLDRFTRRVFTAGRGPADDLYLNHITLSPGQAARIKGVEVHLEEQYLADGLPLIYRMQAEPGLQHIFVSGDIILSRTQLGAGDPDLEPALQADYAQTSLRQIQRIDPGHYSLDYLSASEFIELANVGVEIADLVVVATYAGPAIGPAVGPTATPLPLPPPVPGEEP